MPEFASTGVFQEIMALMDKIIQRLDGFDSNEEIGGQKGSDVFTDCSPIVDSFTVQRKEEQMVMVINTSCDIDALAKDKVRAIGVEARIAASKAKAAEFATFLKTEREKNKSGPKFIRANIADTKVKSTGDSTPATNLGDSPREVENGGVEHYSFKDSSPATNLGDSPREVENGGVEHYSVKDSSPATNPGVMFRKVKGVELCSKGDSIPANSLEVRPNEVECCSKGDSVELCSKGDSIPANLGYMPIKTDSEEMLAPSNNEYKIISSQKKFKFGPTIGKVFKVSPISKDSSVNFDDLPTFAFKNYGVNIAPSIYLKICELIFSGKPLASKGGG